METPKDDVVHEKNEVDFKKNFVEGFAYSHDWIKRHQDCDTCDLNEWKHVATSLSNSIQSYLKWLETGR